MGPVTRGRLVVGSLSAHARARYRPETCQPRLEKSHLLGASPCSSTPQGGPLYGWKKRGIFAVVGSGQRGLRVCLHVRQVLAQRAQLFESRGG